MNLSCPLCIILDHTKEKAASKSSFVVSLLSLYVCVYPLSLLGNSSVVRQQLGKHVPAAKNTRTTIEELDTILYVVRTVSKESRQSVLHQTSCL